MSQRSQVVEESSLHKYRTEIPNIVLDSGMDCYEFRLYCEYKRIAGDGGQCTKSTKNIALSCKMSERKLRATKAKLSKPRDNLGKKSLIRVTHRTSENGDPDTDIVTIVDLWEVNFSHFIDKKNEGGTARRAGGVGHSVPEGGARRAAKEEPIKEEPSEELFVAEGGCPPSASENPSSSQSKKEKPRVETQTPHKHTIKTTGGLEKTITESDCYLMAAKKRTDWAIEDIKYAWEALCSYKGIIHDWARFIEGTIEKYRNTKKGEKICRQSAKKESKTCKESISEKDTLGPISVPLVSVMETLKKYQSGLHIQAKC